MHIATHLDTLSYVMSHDPAVTLREGVSARPARLVPLSDCAAVGGADVYAIRPLQASEIYALPAEVSEVYDLDVARRGLVSIGGDPARAAALLAGALPAAVLIGLRVTILEATNNPPFVA